MDWKERSLPSKETLRGHSDSSFRSEGYIQCCVGVRLCDMYTNQELAEIHFMYGKADGNAALARRLYQESVFSFCLTLHYTTGTHPHRKQNKWRQDEQRPVLKMTHKWVETCRRGNVCIMIDNDVSFRQRAVIKFLDKEEKSSAEIQLRLQRAYGDVCMGASSVRRLVKHFENGNTSIQDVPRSGRPRTASTESNKERVYEF
ncbi:hypothetical protein ANN_25178 [Periplaneta americana]|uniref:Mos1 transposase HTH domain-containing protein n=1 Tax=Periplaneta americana TaxID=6978 RepID=A0ABQ8S185_PERAM|nr:hypothetical protein ANN_25178 [Periplaneta americana]